jgi:hypothetical protein
LPPHHSWKDLAVGAILERKATDTTLVLGISPCDIRDAILDTVLRYLYSQVKGDDQLR